MASNRETWPNLQLKISLLCFIPNSVVASQFILRCLSSSPFKPPAIQLFFWLATWGPVPCSQSASGWGQSFDILQSHKQGKIRLTVESYFCVKSAPQVHHNRKPFWNLTCTSPRSVTTHHSQCSLHSYKCWQQLQPLVKATSLALHRFATEV